MLAIALNCRRQCRAHLQGIDGLLHVMDPHDRCPRPSRQYRSGHTGTHPGLRHSSGTNEMPQQRFSRQPHEQWITMRCEAPEPLEQRQIMLDRLTHMQGTPATMQQAPQYRDVLSEVESFLLKRARLAESSGIPAGWIHRRHQ